MRLSAAVPVFLGLYVLALLGALLPVTFSSYSVYDEFTILSDGARILTGEVMYRDFFEFITPLSPALAAAIFALTGVSMLGARLMQAALLFVGCLLLYALARRFALPRPVAALPGLALAVSCFPKWGVYSHHWVVIPFTAGALLAGLSGLASGRRRWWGLAGVASAFAILTVQSDGLAIVGVLGGGLVASALVGEVAWRTVARQAAAFTLGLVLPLGAAVLYFTAHGALADVWAATWVFPTSQYRMAGNTNNIAFGMGLASDLPGPMSTRLWYQRAYHLAFGYLLMALMPLLALLWGLDALVRRVRTGVALAPHEVSVGMLSLAPLASLAVLLSGRADTSHVFFHLHFCLVFAAVAAWRWRARFDALRHGLLRWLPLVTLVAFVGVGAFETLKKVQFLWPAVVAFKTPDSALANDPVLRWVMARTVPGDFISVFPWGGFYYLFGRPSATGYSVLYHPALNYNTEAQFAEAMAQLAARRPRYVLITSAPRDVSSPDNPYSRALPPGYRLVEQMRSALFIHPVYIYQRAEGQESGRGQGADRSPPAPRRPVAGE